jgi:hypothetical protein
MLHSTGSDYFQTLYQEIYQAFRTRSRTERLNAVLKEISVDIRDPSCMTVAGKYASEGRIDIAFWCYETLGALATFIVEGLIRGGKEKEALTWCEAEYVNPIALVRGYAFIGHREKVEQCLEKYPSLDVNKCYIYFEVMNELAVSALLGNQIDYYQEIHKKIDRTEEITNALGMMGNLSLIQWFLTDIKDSAKFECLRPLIQGFMQGARPEECLSFLEEQAHIHVGAWNIADILHSKAIGAARAGNIKEAQEYLHNRPEYRESVAMEAAQSGYGAGADEIYGDRITNSPDVVKDVLFHAAKNGMMDALPSLLDYYDRHPSFCLPLEYVKQYRFTAGFSPFWSAVSARHFLARISDSRVVQMLMPIIEKEFGMGVKYPIEVYIKEINSMRNKYTLNYHQAACFVNSPDAEDKTQPWNFSFGNDYTFNYHKDAYFVNPFLDIEKAPRPLNYFLWVSSKTPPSVNRVSSKEEKVVLPWEVVCRITRFFSPISMLTDQEARELHTISFKPGGK